MKTVTPYLMFNGNCEEAFNFYKEVLGGELTISRFSDMEEDPDKQLSEEEKNLVANVSLDLNGPEQQIMGSDIPSSMPKAKTGDNIMIMLDCDSADEVDRLHNALKEGESPMPPQETEWAERFAGCTDKYGIGWMFNYTGSKTFGE
jgi:PhnB protein